MSRSFDGPRATQSLRHRLIKAFCVLAVVFVLYRILREEHNRGQDGVTFGSYGSSGLSYGIGRQKCIKPHDASKPLLEYAVIIDAGSTGSRVHVYRFNNCGPTPELEKEFFKMTDKRPGGSGLSSYNEADEAAKSLDPLLLFAQASVPPEYQSCTPIVVKATAGLRVVGEDRSRAILEAVRTRIEARYPFVVVSRDKGGVEIMKGEDEGVFAWVTTNYLLARLDNIATAGDSRSTVAVFDLGGGSAQVAFEPEFRDTHEATSMVESGATYPLKFAGRGFQLYQHSHLGYGLMAARKELHRLVVEETYRQNAYLDSWLSRPLPNPCLPPGTQVGVAVELPIGHSLAGTHEVTMEGAVVAEPGQCRTLVEAILRTKESCLVAPCSINGVYQPSLDETFAGEVYIFSYFYDRTHNLGMPDSFTIRELYDLTTKVCAGEGSWGQAFGHVEGAVRGLKDMPEWCLDLTYMSALLHKGYGLPLYRKVKVASQIKGNEIGWCLGASLPLLEGDSGWECRQSNQHL